MLHINGLLLMQHLEMMIHPYSGCIPTKSDDSSNYDSDIVSGSRGNNVTAFHISYTVMVYSHRHNKLKIVIVLHKLKQTLGHVDIVCLGMPTSFQTINRYQQINTHML